MGKLKSCDLLKLVVLAFVAMFVDQEAFTTTIPRLACQDFEFVLRFTAGGAGFADGSGRQQQPAGPGARRRRPRQLQRGLPEDDPRVLPRPRHRETRAGAHSQVQGGTLNHSALSSARFVFRQWQGSRSLIAVTSLNKGHEKLAAG